MRICARRMLHFQLILLGSFTYIFFSEYITERKSKGEVLIFKRSYFKKMKHEAKLKGDIESGSVNEKTTEKGSSDGDSDVNILRQTSVSILTHRA